MALDESVDIDSILSQVKNEVFSEGYLSKPVSSLNPGTPVCANESETVSASVKQMVDNKIGCVLIVNNDNQLTGIFSERDFLVKVSTKFASLGNHPVKECMTPSPYCASLDDKIAYAITVMIEGKFRHLPFIDEAGSPVGIISLRNILNLVVECIHNSIFGNQAEQWEK